MAAYEPFAHDTHSSSSAAGFGCRLCLMRVLVVEDEKKTASFIRKALQAEGFAVDVCHNGHEALAAPSATPYDAIVLDIMLPGRDGLSVLRQWRQHVTPSRCCSFP